MIIDQKHAVHLGVMCAKAGGPESACPYVAGSWMAMWWLRGYRQISGDTTPVPDAPALVREPPAAPSEAVAPSETAAQAALRMLAETDHVEFRRDIPGRRLSSEWLDWREELRRTVRGERTEAPTEPERYAEPETEQPPASKSAASVTATMNPAVPPAPDETELLRLELLAAIDREHDRRRAATYSPEQELQIHANRVALLGHLFGVIEGTFPTPTPEERTALAARWADLSTLDALATTSASKRVEVLSLAANELKDYDVTTGWPT